MSLNSTPSGDRIHIGIFGKRNSGKSSLINAVTGQELSIVSDIKGTTTDPVKKAMELLPLGPVVLIDTPGIDDEGELGLLRVERSYRMLNMSDIAVLVVDVNEGFGKEEKELLKKVKEKEIPYIIAFNKCDEK
ncbi:MAG: 50S ribosome-binding GTPase, partial [Clostridiales bacterium]|nr:50S ribosome-binding GTPase [Clostridiales bacterium]